MSSTSEQKSQDDPLQHLVVGYPKLAGHMEMLPEISMFRRFGSLNARNLLYLQCELSTLERKLIEVETVDSLEVHAGKKGKFALDAWWLVNSDEERDGDTIQLDLVLQMREKLKEYNEALIQNATIMNLKEADKFDLKWMQNLLHSPMMGECKLIGDDALIWGSVTKRNEAAIDLVALKPRISGDSFSRWLAANAIRWFHRFMKPKALFGAAAYQDTTIFKITIFNHHFDVPFIKKAKLGTIAAFNIFISICLIVFTDAKRTDVFSVTAAFAAVQAVFVATDNDRAPTSTHDSTISSKA